MSTHKCNANAIWRSILIDKMNSYYDAREKFNKVREELGMPKFNDVNYVDVPIGFKLKSVVLEVIE